MVNDIVESFDATTYSTAFFIDLPKTFETIDHAILCQTLSDLGWSDQAVGWFSIYLFNSKQCVQFSGLSCSFLSITEGVSRIVADNCCWTLSVTELRFITIRLIIILCNGHHYPCIVLCPDFCGPLITHLHATYTVLPQPPVPGIHPFLHSPSPYRVW